jgi:alkylation response protein AidB-like acyl-CoA dehydrogenase
MIQHKLAEMAIRIYAAESVTYRVEGLIQSHLEGFSWNEADAPRRMMKAVEEFAAECSIIKVYASEMLDYVVDEGVQIHGGYGYHQDYAVERAYRDSRINRIFEGTNEINRLLITGMLLKRAQQGRLGLVKAAKSLMDEVLSGPSAGGSLVSNAKKIGLLLMALAFEKYGVELEKQQEVVAGIADVIMEIFAMESAQLRSQKNGDADDICQVLLCDAMARIEMFARPVLAACSEGDALRANMAVLRRFTKYEPVDAIALRRRIAERLLSAGRYIV